MDEKRINPAHTEPSWYKGWMAGYREGLGAHAYKQCGCVFNEDEEVIGLCDLHSKLLDEIREGKIPSPPEPKYIRIMAQPFF